METAGSRDVRFDVYEQLLQKFQVDDATGKNIDLALGYGDSQSSLLARV